MQQKDNPRRPYLIGILGTVVLLGLLQLSGLNALWTGGLALAVIIGTGIYAFYVRRFRISLRTFFYVITVLCFVLAITAKLKMQHSNRILAIDQIRKLGGTVIAENEAVHDASWLKAMLIGANVLCIDVSDNLLFSDTEAAVLSHFRELRELNLSGTSVSNACLTSLEEMTKLESLHVDGSRIQVDALLRLFASQGRPVESALEVLGVRLATGADGSIQSVAYPPLLCLEDLHNSLDLKNVQEITGRLTDSDAEFISSYQKLRRISAARSEVTDRFCQTIGRLPTLESIDLRDSHVSDDGLKLLGGLKQLGERSFQLAGSRVTFAGVHHLFVDLQERATIDAFRSVCIFSGPGDSRLTCHTGVEFTDTDLVLLKTLPNLKSLHLSSSRITNTGVRAIQACSGLRSLFLTNTTITDEGLETIAQMNGLKQLGLEGSRITNRGVLLLLNLENLEHLRLGNTNISDAAIAALGQMTALKRLHVENTQLTQVGINALKAQLPALHIFSHP